MIMVIDDSPTVRKIIEVALNREGYEVELFPDGIEAIRYFCKPEAEIPDLIFLDIAMPKVTGLALLQHFRKKPTLASVPVVIISRSCGILERLYARILGVKAYLPKPFLQQHIVEAARLWTGGGSCHNLTV